MKKTILFIIILILIFSSFSYANSDILSNYPPIPPDESGDFFITENNGITYLKYFDSRQRYKDGYQLTQGGYVVFKSFSRYVLSTDGSTWEKKSVGYNSSWIGNVIYSSANIYNEDGTVFFSLPKGITEIIQEETVKILPYLVGQTRTILQVGFGIASAMLLVTLLVVYFKRYLLRSI